MAALFGAAIESSYQSGAYEEAGEWCDKILNSGIVVPPSILAQRVLIAFAVNDFEMCRQQLDQFKQLGLPLTEQLQSIDQHVDALIVAWKREQELRDAEAERDDLPRVRLVCDVEGNNEVVIELFEDSAPRNVANFIELVKRGFYDNLTFHQVVTHVAARSGSPAGDGNDEPEYFVQGEANAPQARHSFRGAVAMESMRDQNLHGTLFYVALSPSIDNSVRATIIGRVISGMDVISKLNLTHVSNDEKKTFERVDGVPPNRILKAEVIRDRGHEYSAEKFRNSQG
jgi:peptidyl-prolyl cis-trans isomerase B (cyclophilin B)